MSEGLGSGGVVRPRCRPISTRPMRPYRAAGQAGVSGRHNVAGFAVIRRSLVQLPSDCVPRALRSRLTGGVDLAAERNAVRRYGRNYRGPGGASRAPVPCQVEACPARALRMGQHVHPSVFFMSARWKPGPQQGTSPQVPWSGLRTIPVEAAGRSEVSLAPD